jgi:hypothetical protein
MILGINAFLTDHYAKTFDMPLVRQRIDMFRDNQDIVELIPYQYVPSVAAKHPAQRPSGVMAGATITFSDLKTARSKDVGRSAATHYVISGTLYSDLTSRRTAFHYVRYRALCEQLGLYTHLHDPEAYNTRGLIVDRASLLNASDWRLGILIRTMHLATPEEKEAYEVQLAQWEGAVLARYGKDLPKQVTFTMWQRYAREAIQPWSIRSCIQNLTAAGCTHAFEEHIRLNLSGFENWYREYVAPKIIIGARQLTKR